MTPVTVPDGGHAGRPPPPQKKTDTRQNRDDTTLSMLLNNKTLLLYQIQSKESPVELTFNPKYGDIVSHSWCGDGYLVMELIEGDSGLALHHHVALLVRLVLVGDASDDVQLEQPLRVQHQISQAR